VFDSEPRALNDSDSAKQVSASCCVGQREPRSARQLWEQYQQGAEDNKTERVTRLENFIKETVNGGQADYNTVVHSLPELHRYDESERIRKLLKIVKALLLEQRVLEQHVPRTVTAVWGETQGLFSHAQIIREQANAISIEKQLRHIQWQEQPRSACTDPCVVFFRMGERLSDSHMQRIVKFCTGASVPSVTRASLLCSCARTVRLAQLRRPHGK
jgi:hypothetical protein